MQRKLIIHDMSEAEWQKVRDRYDGWEVISDNGSIHPCTGCFSCWKKTPGRCIIRDGYDQMGARINRAEEIVYSSRFTYGGFSSFVKNVFDRSLGYVLPYFEVSENEMHHKARYEDVKKITFIFRGHDLSEDDKERATQYVEAVCRNLRGQVKEVLFEEIGETEKAAKESIPFEKGTVALLNCSIRGRKANSEKFLTRLDSQIQKPHRYFRLAEYAKREDELIQEISKAETLVFAMPLYVDGLPSNVIRLLEKMPDGSGRKVCVLSNLGLYESHQLKNQIGMMQYWCEKSHYDYSGTLAISSGELIGVLIEKMSWGPVSTTTKGIRRLADAVNTGIKFGENYIQPFLFPRWLYILIANISWDLNARKEGLKPQDLYVRLNVDE